MNFGEFSKMAFKLADNDTGRRGGWPSLNFGDFHSPVNDRGSITVAAVAGVVLATLFSFPPLTPLIHTAVVFPFFYAAQRRQDRGWAATIIVRWMIAIFLGTMVAGAFTPERVIASLLFGPDAVAAVNSWLAGSGPAPVGWAYLLWGVVAFLALCVASGGLMGIALASVALGTCAAPALFLFRSGFNVWQLSIVAVPLWQGCLLAAIPWLLVPTSSLFYQRVLSIDYNERSLSVARKQFYLGAGLLVSSLLLKMVLADPWRQLLRHWTTL